MNNTSLADSYLKLSGLDSALSKLVSEFTAAQLQSLGTNSLKNSLDIFRSSLSSISQLASDITITPELQKSIRLTDFIHWFISLFHYNFCWEKCCQGNTGYQN